MEQIPPICSICSKRPAYAEQIKTPENTNKNRVFLYLFHLFHLFHENESIAEKG